MMEGMSLVSKIRSVFEEKYGKNPTLFLAPGRINLIGEHTDYNDGFVMPSAIDKHIVFAIAPNNTENFNIYSVDLNESTSFSSNDLKAGGSWSNYLMGVISGLQQRGFSPKGVDCVFGGNIPTGAGLSSSAALCCGFGFALNEQFGFGLNRTDLALIAQYSEHKFAGVMCGIMDQYASLFSKEGSALLLDCRSLQHEYIPVPMEEYEILLIDTKVKHSLASSAYNDRRAACEEGVVALHKKYGQVKSLRDASLDMLDEIKATISNDVYVKCAFIIKEIERTQKAAIFLKGNDLISFGKLMYETHWGLSHDYEVSCEESDFLVTVASQNPKNIAGARQIGGGFGGCTVNIIKKDSSSSFISQVRENYFATFKKEPDFYSANLCKGVHEITE